VECDSPAEEGTVRLIRTHLPGAAKIYKQKIIYTEHSHFTYEKQFHLEAIGELGSFFFKYCYHFSMRLLFINSLSIVYFLLLLLFFFFF
jgi:hypothetical protein